MAEMKTCFLELWSWFLNSFYDWITKLMKVDFHFWHGPKVVHTLVWLECQIWNSNFKWYLKDVYEIRKWAQKFILCAKSRTTAPGEEIAFTARPKIHSLSQIFRYGQSIFCLPHRPNFSDIFDLCLHWVSVVRVLTNLQGQITKRARCAHISLLCSEVALMS